MFGKRGTFSDGLEKKWALRWRWAADCSRGGFQPLEMHDRRQWTAVYVGSLAAKMTTTGDGGGWNRRRAGCSRKDIVAPDHAGIGKWAEPTWNRCVSETAASEGLAASVWLAHTEKIDVSVWRRRWAPSEMTDLRARKVWSASAYWPSTNFCSWRNVCRKREIINNPAGDCSISLKFRTDFDRATLDVPRTFKINWSKIKVTAWHNVSA